LETGRNILICPLEWGLGHAGRMIPVARKLLAAGNNVFIGSGEDHLEFFRKEVPGLSYIDFPGFRIKYSRWLPQYIVIFFTTPLFIFRSIQEHYRLKTIIRNYKIDILISDSRIGLWNKRISTALVTHMMRVPHPRGLRFLENAGNPLVKIITGKFNFCLIPDLPGEVNISGKLSHCSDLPLNARYTGLLSRFGNHGKESDMVQKKYYCTVILSGPEPQKTILRDKLTEILKTTDKPSVILEGSPRGEIQRSVNGNITFISHLPSSGFVKLIMESENIVTRSGYTTIMELISLGRSALLIPTPGQPEQEYLAEYLTGKGWFKTISQDALSPDTDISETKTYFPAEMMTESEKLLNAALKELLEE
jgi:predicted glycosyltransferase